MQNSMTIRHPARPRAVERISKRLPDPAYPADCLATRLTGLLFVRSSPSVDRCLRDDPEIRPDQEENARAVRKACRRGGCDEADYGQDGLGALSADRIAYIRNPNRVISRIYRPKSYFLSGQAQMVAQESSCPAPKFNLRKAFCPDKPGWKAKTISRQEACLATEDKTSARPSQRTARRMFSWIAFIHLGNPKRPRRGNYGKKYASNAARKMLQEALAHPEEEVEVLAKNCGWCDWLYDIAPEGLLPKKVRQGRLRALGLTTVTDGISPAYSPGPLPGQTARLNTVGYELMQDATGAVFLTALDGPTLGSFASSQYGNLDNLDPNDPNDPNDPPPSSPYGNVFNSTTAETSFSKRRSRKAKPRTRLRIGIVTRHRVVCQRPQTVRQRRQTFRQRSWQLHFHPDVATVKVAVVDSAATDYGSTENDTFAHGRAVGRLITDLACPLDAPYDIACKKIIHNYPALDYQKDGISTATKAATTERLAAWPVK